jgi:hypothetical protein
VTGCVFSFSNLDTRVTRRISSGQQYGCSQVRYLLLPQEPHSPFPPKSTTPTDHGHSAASHFPFHPTMTTNSSIRRDRHHGSTW